MIMLSQNIRPSEMKGVLLHEAVHIIQYETKDLIIHDFMKHIYIYRGDTLNLNEIEYVNRPFERDAYQMQEQLYVKLDSILCN